MKPKKIFYLIIVSLLMLSMVSWVYLDFILSSEKKLAKKFYSDESKFITKTISENILSKQKSTLAIAISMANDQKLQELLLSKKIPLNYNKDLLNKIKKYSSYKHIWLQILDDNGISLYRSWTNTKGDSLTKIRDDINSIISNPKISYSISFGKFDLSIKSMVPVFINNHFAGIVEIISHFNSISKKLSKKGIDSIVLLDKKYSNKLKHPFTKLFLKEYYIANLNAMPDLINYFQKRDLEKYLKEGYIAENGNLIVTYPLKSQNFNTIGYYIAFKKIGDIELIHLFILKWISIGIIITLLFGLFIGYVLMYTYRKKKVYYKNIIDSSSNIIIINNGRYPIYANTTFFKYFRFKTLKDFLLKHQCICEFCASYQKILKNKPKNISWISYLFSMQNEPNKTIKLDIEQISYYFHISISKISEDDYVIVLVDITKEEEYKQELKNLTVTDELTGLYNRRFCYQELSKEIAQSKRYNYGLSIIMFDIDFFKKINDKYGHDTGDKVLQEYSSLIQNSLRDSDTLCRIGGEEFIVILPQTEINDAAKLAEKLRKLVESSKLVVKLTISLGVSEYNSNDDIDSFIKRSDDALYKAKRSGRNRVEAI